MFYSVLCDKCRALLKLDLSQSCFKSKGFIRCIYHQVYIYIYIHMFMTCIFVSLMLYAETLNTQPEEMDAVPSPSLRLCFSKGEKDL